MSRITLTNVPFITFTIGHLSYFLEPLKNCIMDFKCTYSLDFVEELLRENTPTQYPEKALGDLHKENCLY